MTKLDHPIFNKSIDYIRSRLRVNGLDELEQQVLERLIHTSGDFGIQEILRFSPSACQIGVNALKSGADILVDTSMAVSAIHSMAKKTLNTQVKCILDWSPDQVDSHSTRTAIGIQKAWSSISQENNIEATPIVVIGSAPTALHALLDLIDDGYIAPSLIVGMPVGFIEVTSSKKRLFNSNFPYIIIEGNRGGAALASATVNALLRASTFIK